MKETEQTITERERNEHICYSLNNRFKRAGLNATAVVNENASRLIDVFVNYKKDNEKRIAQGCPSYHSSITLDNDEDNPDAIIIVNREWQEVMELIENMKKLTEGEINENTD